MGMVLERCLEAGGADDEVDEAREWNMTQHEEAFWCLMGSFAL